MIAAFILVSFLLSFAQLMQQRETLSSGQVGALVFLAVLYLTSYLAMVVTTVVVTASDPTDPTVAFERVSRVAKARGVAVGHEFNENCYNFYCDVCDTHVLKDTKHCQRCNRCSYEFDHHCEWVSNDIGQHNYVEFIRMLVAVLTTITFQLIFASIALKVNDNMQ